MVPARHRFSQVYCFRLYVLNSIDQSWLRHSVYSSIRYWELMIRISYTVTNLWLFRPCFPRISDFRMTSSLRILTRVNADISHTLNPLWSDSFGPLTDHSVLPKPPVSGANLTQKTDKVLFMIATFPAIMHLKRYLYLSICCTNGPKKASPHESGGEGSLRKVW